MDGYKIIQQFQSKRNKVWLTSKDEMLVVLKEHSSYESAAFEENALKTLQPYVNVPKLLCAESNYLVLEYIGGTVAVDYLMQCNSIKTVELARLMFAFCRTYSDIMHPYCIKDTNFRNFIVTEKNSKIKLYGVDFEDRDTGSVLNSAANLCAFAFLYDIEAAKKRLFCNAILYEIINLHYDINTFYNEIRKCLEELVIRRGLDTSAEKVFNSLTLSFDDLA